MHGTLLVLLSAAWLGPMLLPARGGASLACAWLAAASLGLAGLATLVPGLHADFLLALAFASVLMFLGNALAGTQRRAGLRTIALAVGGGLLAVAIEAALWRQSPAVAVARALVPALALGLLAPAAAAMSQRLRETEAPPALRAAVLPVLAASALALGLMALMPALAS
jgi:hypothetical protein